MPCKKLTIEEFDALAPGTPGYQNQNECPCKPCTRASDCTTPLQCCSDGIETECMTRLGTPYAPAPGNCNSILFRRTTDGSQIVPGFRWMVQYSGGTVYTNETPSPALAEQYCPGGTGYWHVSNLANQNPCGFGAFCFFYYRCIY